MQRPPSSLGSDRGAGAWLSLLRCSCAPVLLRDEGQRRRFPTPAPALARPLLTSECNQLGRRAVSDQILNMTSRRGWAARTVHPRRQRAEQGSSAQQRCSKLCSTSPRSLVEAAWPDRHSSHSSRNGEAIHLQRHRDLESTTILLAIHGPACLSTAT
jgi:hypothetical protein